MYARQKRSLRSRRLRSSEEIIGEPTTDVLDIQPCALVRRDHWRAYNRCTGHTTMCARQKRSLESLQPMYWTYNHVRSSEEIISTSGPQPKPSASAQQG